MCVFYAVVIRMFGSIFLVCGYFFLVYGYFFWSHCYVNVCAFAWILILFLIVHFIMKGSREYDWTISALVVDINEDLSTKAEKEISVSSVLSELLLNSIK